MLDMIKFSQDKEVPKDDIDLNTSRKPNLSLNM